MKFLVTLACVVFLLENIKSDLRFILRIWRRQKNLKDQINQFLNGLNKPIYSLRTNSQTHFDNSVRTLTESLRGFNINANRASYTAAGDNRKVLQKCLSDIRDTMEIVLEFLRKKANSPVFDYSSDTETQIEANLKCQTDELAAAIDSKNDAKCLAAIGITVWNLNIKYTKYSSSLSTCINQVSGNINIDIINRFNPEHFPALSLLNRIQNSLSSSTTRVLIATFISNFCNSKTISEFNEVMTSAENCMLDGAPKINACYDSAVPLIPASTPFLDLVTKCA